MVGRVESNGLFAVCYEVVEGRRFGHGPHVVALANTSSGRATLLGAKVVDRDAWTTPPDAPLRLADAGGTVGRILVYSPIVDHRGRYALLRHGSGTDLEVLFDRRVTNVSDVRLEDRTSDGAVDVVIVPLDGGADQVVPFDASRGRWGR